MCSHFPNNFSRGTVQKFRGTLVCRGTPFENPCCNQITLLILYYISSRLVTLPTKVSDIFYLTVSYKFINFSFQIFFLIVPEVTSSSILAFRYFFLLFLKCLLASRFTLFRLSTLLQFGSCNHCILASFLCSKKCKHSSSNQGLRCFNSHRPRLSLAEVIIFSLMFSQGLFMPSIQLKFSKAAKLLGS